MHKKVMNKLIRGPICFEYSAILAMLGVTCQSRDKNDSSCRQGYSDHEQMFQLLQ